MAFPYVEYPRCPWRGNPSLFQSQEEHYSSEADRWLRNRESELEKENNRNREEEIRKGRF